MKRSAGFPFVVLLFVMTSGFSQVPPEEAERSQDPVPYDAFIDALQTGETDNLTAGKECRSPVLSPVLFVGENTTGVYLDLGLPGDDNTESDQDTEEIPLRSDLFHQVSHFYGSKSGVESLISAFGSGSFDGLFNIICSEHAKDYRHTCINTDICNAFGHFRGNEIKMWRSTPDNCSKTNYSIVLFTLGELFGQ
jgi:hypothetical protein